MNYYGVTRSTDHLAHYGVKGMRWGVRRAIATGNARALDRQYRKAAKKLAKLQDIGNHSAKYGAKAAGYGAAAATTGAMTIGGTKTAGNMLGLVGNRIIPFKNAALMKIKGYNPSVAKNLAVARNAKDSMKLKRTIENFNKWGSEAHNLDPIIEKAKNTHKKALDFLNIDSSKGVNTANTANNASKITKSKSKLVTNDTLFRIGAGAVTAGLAAKAVQNAYRAKHGEKYRDKATAFKEAMDETFAGTPYEGHYEKVRRRRRR